MRRIMGQSRCGAGSARRWFDRGGDRGAGIAYVGCVREQLPLFPLNTVMFPGVSVPLHVFEDRYRALVHHLLTISDKSMRLFGIVAIREGYEVGQPHLSLVQSLHRVGCVVQMTSVEPYEDGRFDIEVVGRQRLRLEGIDTSGSYLVGDVETLSERTRRAPTPPTRPPGPGTRSRSTGAGSRRCAAATCSTATCRATRSTSPTAWPPPAC